MKQGDFTKLAENYINRPAYDKYLINAILNHVGYEKKRESFKIADVGAGTGKLTKVLLELGLDVTAVEPNGEMRAEGVKYTEAHNVKWIEGSGEKTNLEDNTYDLVIMGSSFHWTDPTKSLPEFSRILKSGGSFTAIWNPRDIQSSELHLEIEDIINNNVPKLKRVSSGSGKHTKDWSRILASTSNFTDIILMETNYNEVMSIERYMGVWKSVNDIRAQAGEEKFTEILNLIEEKIKHLDTIEVPYKMRAWTGKKVS